MRENDQNRWEYEVQRWEERQETKRKLLEFSISGALWILFAAVMFGFLAL